MPGLVSPCANVPPKHYYAGAPSLQPGLSAARGDTDGLKAIQPSQSIFFLLYTRMIMGLNQTPLQHWHRTKMKCADLWRSGHAILMFL